MSEHDPPPGRPSLLSRARRKVAQTARRPARTVAQAAENWALRRAEHAGRAAIQALGQRTVDVVDRMVSRVLELDQAAAELTIIAEEGKARHGRDAVMEALWRRNLLLDGTFFQLLSPAITAMRAAPEHTQSLDPRALLRARATVASFCVELLSEQGDPSPSVEGHDTLEHLVGLGMPERFPHVWAWLEGRADEEDDARFLLGSYLIFLQTFTMRTAARLMAGQDATPVLPRSGEDEQS